ncbi:hypothetical protein EOK75_01745 [Pseudorhodobacter turbinis]|uniref:Uncharacterized protein n=1 Tax=Pseudorhodobacter turbinis TaxID=2500533 RepID=A0A4P8ECY7_9RHOB|nr:hypothetical protein [Pseudorhodobacter turbinis]QCO54642.1 hypothetical protein EOK75_01745 [Pseudorhodobacter turbinis]
MSDKEKNHQSISNDTEMPFPLDGSELHFELKNQPGEKGDPDHAGREDSSKSETTDPIQDAAD